MSVVQHTSSKTMDDKQKFQCSLSQCKKGVLTDIQFFNIPPLNYENKTLNQLLIYFLHLSPDIESTWSLSIKREKHLILFQQMFDNRHFEYKKFCGSNTKIEPEMIHAGLLGKDLCLKCKRFVCKKRQNTKKILPETDLDCFLRHVRNSIAHGNVFIFPIKNIIRILFEDYNETGKLSARILCLKSDLEHWKKILSNKNNYI